MKFDWNEIYNIVWPLALYVIGMVVYALFIFKFYRFLARKDIFKLNLKEKYGVGKFLGVIWYGIEHLVMFPLAVFLWFAVISLLLMVGQPGPLVRHPPTVCYRNLAQRTLSQSVIDLSHEGTSHSFNRVEFEARNEGVGEFTVYYGYTADRLWSAPQRPRVAFGGDPALYKLQVLCSESDPAAGKEFLKDFVATFQRFGE